jgi:hypothetical protein
LVERFENNLELAADQDTLHYGAKGYNDYPTATK